MIELTQLFIAQKALELAECRLTEADEYVREELWMLQHSLDTLLDKVAVETALIRDRDALLSEPEEGLGEHIAE